MKNPKLKIESRSNVPIRKKRDLQEFYAEPVWNDELSPFFKRNSDVPRDIQLTISGDVPDKDFQDFQVSPTIPVEYFSEIVTAQQSRTHFTTYRPEETAMNFYKKFVPTQRATLVPDNLLYQDVQTSKLPTLDGMIQQANSMLKTSFRQKEYDHSTMKVIPEERLTFEDKESMLISYCNDSDDCGINAVCYKEQNGKKFCKCKPHYKGNGFSCWMF